MSIPDSSAISVSGHIERGSGWQFVEIAAARFRPASHDTIQENSDDE